MTIQPRLDLTYRIQLRPLQILPTHDLEHFVRPWISYHKHHLHTYYPPVQNHPRHLSNTTHPCPCPLVAPVTPTSLIPSQKHEPNASFLPACEKPSPGRKHGENVL